MNILNDLTKTPITLIIEKLLFCIILDNYHYLTLDDLNQNSNYQLYQQLKQLIPQAFQDNILNLQSLKQALGIKAKFEEQNVFGLYWNGKNQAKAIVNQPINDKTLLPVRAKSLNFDQAQNVIVEGDNLQVLKLLTKAYFNQVDVIYIDPPYNTGNDFVYNDDFKQDSYEYKIANNLIDDQGLKTTTNQKTEGRFHTNWLNMIYPRLELARKLLKDDGVIFISIDDNEQARLKLICDEIFGEQNFISTLIWIRNPGGESDNSYIANTKDFILVYAKQIGNFKINEIKSEKNILDFITSENGIWKKGSMLEKSGENDRLIDRKNLGYVVYYNEESKSVVVSHDYDKSLVDINLSKETKIYNFNSNLISQGFIPIIPRIIKNTYGRWRISDKKFLELFAEDSLIFDKRKDGSFKIFEKIKYTIENPYTLQKPKDIISFTTNSKGTNEMKKLFSLNPFSKPKPCDLISYLINLNSNKNALVLDFFAGSGTTAQAVMALNQEDSGTRRYILVQLPEPIANNPEFQTICDVTRQRVERAIIKYNYDDAGFKYFQLGPTNFDVWKVQSDDSPANFKTQLELFETPPNLNANVNYEAILYELMLKYGLKLNQKVMSKTLHDHQYWIDDVVDYLFFLKPQCIDGVLDIIKTHTSKDKLTTIFISESYFKSANGDEMKINLCEAIKQLGHNVKLWIC